MKMWFKTVCILLLPFIALAAKDWQQFVAIQSAVDAVRLRTDVNSNDQVCYPDIGCFTTDGPMKHIGKLPDSPDKIGTKFYAYTLSAPDTAQEVNPKDAKSLEIVAKNKRLVIECHGFGMTGKDSRMLAIKNSLFKYAGIETVIIVDWTNGAKSPDYEQASTNTQLVGRQIAFLTDTLRQSRDIDTKNVHLIGFSLGAQVSGFAGKFSQTEYKWKFGRISACDAAAPLFEDYPGSYLTAADGTFVDAIHTSAGHSIITGEVGFVQPIGHVDFYPNNGRKQPRCQGKIDLSCNHGSSVIYYEASLSVTTCPLTAYKCTNWNDFLADKCTKGGDSRMGYHSIEAIGRGVHFLNVTKDYPFC